LGAVGRVALHAVLRRCFFTFTVTSVVYAVKVFLLQKNNATTHVALYHDSEMTCIVSCGALKKQKKSP